MKIKAIQLDDEETPVEITVTMSVAVAAFLADFTGKQTGADPESVEVYDCLTGALFNRFWDDGLHDYQRGASRG